MELGTAERFDHQPELASSAFYAMRSQGSSTSREGEQLAGVMNSSWRTSISGPRSPEHALRSLDVLTFAWAASQNDSGCGTSTSAFGFALCGIVQNGAVSAAAKASIRLSIVSRSHEPRQCDVVGRTSGQSTSIPMTARAYK